MLQNINDAVGFIEFAFICVGAFISGVLMASIIAEFNRKQKGKLK